MKRILRGILIGGLITVLAAIPVLAAYYAYIDVTESLGSSYTNLAMDVSLNCSYLAANGYITANGTDTRVTNSNYNVLPHMLAEDRLLWVGNLSASSSSRFILYTGQPLIENFPVIAGYEGYVTIPDDDALEPGNVYAFGVVCYLESDSLVIYKDGAVSLEVAGGDLVFSVDGGYSLTASGVSLGDVTIMVYCDGAEMWMTIDDVEADRTSASSIIDTGDDWVLFEKVPYVYYYGEWVVT